MHAILFSLTIRGMEEGPRPPVLLPSSISSFGDQDRNHAKWISQRGQSSTKPTPLGPINLWQCEPHDGPLCLTGGSVHIQHPISEQGKLSKKTYTEMVSWWLRRQPEHGITQPGAHLFDQSCIASKASKESISRLLF